MKPIQRVKWGWLLVGCLLVLPLRLGWAGNTHSGTGDAALEFRAYWGDAATGYIHTGCTHGVSGTTTASIASCRAYALTTTAPKQLEYIEDLSARTVTYTAGAGTYWLIAHASTTDPVSGWTRAGVTHYMWRKTPGQPSMPDGGVLLAQVTVTGTAITGVLDWRASNPTGPGLLRVTDPLFGAIPGDGGDDGAAWQAVMDAAKRGNVTVHIPSGVYDINTERCPLVEGYNTSTAVCLIDGADVVIKGEGATIRAGAAMTRLLGIYGAGSTRVEVTGLTLIGHTQTISQQKHGIVVAHKASHVRVHHNYITNFVGDCVNIAGNMENGALLGHTTNNVHVAQNTLKTRVGNGVSSASGGTGSRLAVAITEGRHVVVHDNIIFGGVDLEPNANDQPMASLHVRNNTFHSGPVTAQSSIGTTYHHDEPLVTTGGTTINGYILFTGIPGAPVVQEVVFRENAFVRGYISCISEPYACRIIGNTFREGFIGVSATTGSGTVAMMQVRDNTTALPYPAETAFIKLNGLVTFSEFSGNIAWIPSGYVIAHVGGASGDGGRNAFLNNHNRAIGAIGALNFSPDATSVAGNNSFERQLAVNQLLTRREQFNISIALTPTASPPTLPSDGELYSDNSGALCWFHGGIWNKIFGAGTCN
jgi:hypothetical protein